MPKPSGPRWESARLKAKRGSISGVAPSKRKIPPVPHIGHRIRRGGSRGKVLFALPNVVKIYQEKITVTTAAKTLVDVTDRAAKVVSVSGVRTGLCTVFVQHTSASLIIQENADPSVRRDLERWMSDLAPENRVWEHDAEGPDDMPSHARSAITKTSETIPIMSGKLALGTWQALYLWEHRATRHDRHLVVTVVGE